MHQLKFTDHKNVQALYFNFIKKGFTQVIILCTHPTLSQKYIYRSLNILSPATGQRQPLLHLVKIWSPTPPWPPTSGQQPPPTSGLRQAFRPNPVPCLCRPQHFVLCKMPKQHPQRENRGILDFQTKCKSNTHREGTEVSLISRG